MLGVDLLVARSPGTTKACKHGHHDRYPSGNCRTCAQISKASRLTELLEQPCRHGHIGKRSAADGSCLECRNKAVRRESPTAELLASPCIRGHHGQRSPLNGICLSCVKVLRQERDFEQLQKTPCKRGHVGERSPSGSCRACKKLRIAERRKSEPGFIERCRAKVRAALRKLRANSEYQRRKAQKAQDPAFIEHRRTLGRRNYHKFRDEIAVRRAAKYPTIKTKVAERNRLPEVKARRNEIARAWIARNPGWSNAKSARGRAAKDQRTPKWLSREQSAEIRRFYQEAKRLSSSTGIPHHVDHIVPLHGEAVSGLHVPWNLQILTAAKNLAKGNKFNMETL